MITSTSPFGEALTTCDYGDQFKITAKVSFITFSDAASAAASKASTAATGGATAVPNLGDAAYYNNGTLLVYDGPVAAIQISTSNGASADQLAGLVRTLLGK